MAAIIIFALGESMNETVYIYFIFFPFKSVFM